MRIGLDLDGTIVVYDELFHREAVSRLAMSEGIAVDKTSVRNWIRTLPDGERRWTELQGCVYGRLMRDAPPAPGVLEFLRHCHEEGVAVSIVSHRTRVAVADPDVDLHDAALGWLEHRGLLAGDRYALSLERVFLEPSRVEKIARIASERCALFVDDLPEVLTDPMFPTRTERWLYTPGGHGAALDAIRSFASWDEVLRRVLALREGARGR